MKRRLKLKTKQEETPIVNLAKSVEKAVKPKRTRTPRAFRVFTYRGVRFFLNNRGDRTSISILDDNGQPQPMAEVPRNQAKKAAQALAKVALTEKWLDSIEATPAASSSVDLHADHH